jgi:hypothetical protein
MRNSGGTTWTAASLYRLGAINPHDNVTWGMNRVGLGANVAPGQQYTFTWNVTAPAAGIYNFQWRMVQEGLTWFGTASNNVVVAVNPGPPNAAFVAQSVPATMPAGQLVSVSVTMRNTGGTTWTAAALYRLGAINPHDNSNWGMNRVELGSGDSIAPNQQKTFTWTVRAPATRGPTTSSGAWCRKASPGLGPRAPTWSSPCSRRGHARRTTPLPAAVPDEYL